MVASEPGSLERGRVLTARDVGWVAAWTAVAFCLLGYHPYAEDGGLYSAAIAHRMRPELFPWDRAWVKGHTRLSVFVPVVAWVLMRLHVPLAWGLLGLQVAGLVGLLAVVLVLGRVCFGRRDAAWWGVGAVAVLAGVPVAGTSLYLVDPYATARSVTTPVLLLAAVCVLRRRWRWAAGLWVAAGVAHPLMAVWGGVLLVLMAIGQTGWPGLVVRRVWTGVAGSVLLGLGWVWWMAPAASATTREIALTRGYWFVSAWEWYEVVGLAAPLLLLALGALRWKQCRWTVEARVLAEATMLSCAVGALAAVLFAHADGRTFGVARLQPLRTLHLGYAIFFVLLAGTVSEVTRQLQRLPRIALATVLLLGVGGTAMLGQRTLYRASGWVEWPWAAPKNGWERAFVWVRQNTPVTDRVALDSRYTEVPGEDAQVFRAIAQRSTLADATKDAGVAAVVPELEESWAAGVRAQRNLDGATDQERVARLSPFRVRWVVLTAAAKTELPCPYTNEAAKVCRLP